MRNLIALSFVLALASTATPVLAQSAGADSGTDVTPNAPAAVDIFPAPAAATIGVTAPTVPGVLDMTSTGSALGYGGANASAGINTGSPASTGSTGGGSPGTATGANAASGTASTGTTNANVDPYCTVAADPQATAMGIDATGCGP